jgi:excisionase family DNA binding protein
MESRIHGSPPRRHLPTIRQLLGNYRSRRLKGTTMGQTSNITPLWTVQDVSDYLRVPVQTLYSWRAQGYGPPARRMGKHLRYRPDDVTAWLDQLDEGAA